MNKLETLNLRGNTEQESSFERESSLEKESEFLAQNLEKAKEELGRIDPEKLSEDDKNTLSSKLYEVLVIVGGISGMAILSIEIAARLSSTNFDQTSLISEGLFVLGGLAGVIPFITHRAKKPGIL